MPEVLDALEARCRSHLEAWLAADGMGKAPEALVGPEEVLALIKALRETREQHRLSHIDAMNSLAELSDANRQLEADRKAMQLAWDALAFTTIGRHGCTCRSCEAIEALEERLGPRVRDETTLA